MANIPKPTNLNTIWASTGTRVDPGVTKTNIGWVVQLPPYEYQNWAMNRSDTAIAHINQHGIPEWDANTEYQGNLSYSQGSDGLIYKCIQTNTNLDPTNTNNNLSWVRAFEEYGSVQVVQASLTAHLTNYATLSGISNIVAARANLSVYSKAEGDTRYAFKGGDNATPFLVGTATNPQHAVPLSQINSLLSPATESAYGTTQYATVSETETGAIDTKAVTPLKGATIYLKKSGNLSGLGNIATARTNLGLTSLATTDPATVLFKADNLAGLASQSAARTNLGLGSIAVESSGTFLKASNNLSELTNAQAARNNLGLGSAATRNVVGVANDLNYSFNLSTTSGFMRHPNGMVDQWGIGPFLGNDQGVVINLQVPGIIMSVQVTGAGTGDSSVGPCFLLSGINLNNFTNSFAVYNNYDTSSHQFFWKATVYAP
jgi:hypothetical protein